MSERLRRSRRVLVVQSQLDRLAEWTLIDLQSKIAVLEDQRRDLSDFLSEESAVAGIFSSAMMHRLRAIAETTAALANEREAQRNRRLEARRHLRSAAHLVAALEGAERRKDSLRQFEQAVEAAFQRASQAPGKLIKPL